MAPDEYTVDFPTLWVVPDWVEAHCPIPDGDRKGDPFIMYDWQLWCTVNHYRVRPRAKAGQKAPAFFYRRSQVVAPQKTGKGPWSATVICAEAVGPVLFDGFAAGGEAFDCSDYGCSCGWGYEYRPGEPMGRPWATPLIQLLATAEDQTDNVYRPLQSMVKNGPLAERMRVGEQFIRLPNDGRIDVITSSALARLGNPITFALQDETGLYTTQNKLVRVAETQRRGLSGMGGRAVETTNAPDPSEESTARRTMESKSPDLFRFHRPPPAHLDYAVADDRAEIHRYVYRGSAHVDLDAIEAEASEILEKDQAQAERFFGNRLVAGQGNAVPASVWKDREKPRDVPAGTRVGLGFDGSVSRDATVLRACTADGYSFIVKAWVRPAGVREWKVPRSDVDDAVREAFARWQVGRMFCDPPKWWTEIEAWAEEFGDEVVLAFDTNQDRRMGPAVDRWLTAIAEGTHTHDGDPTTNAHVLAARKRKSRARDPEDDARTLYTLVKGEAGSKIDAAVADVLAFEAAMTMPEVVVVAPRLINLSEV